MFSLQVIDTDNFLDLPTSAIAMKVMFPNP